MKDKEKKEKKVKDKEKDKDKDKKVLIRKKADKSDSDKKSKKDKKNAVSEVPAEKEVLVTPKVLGEEMEKAAKETISMDRDEKFKKDMGLLKKGEDKEENQATLKDSHDSYEVRSEEKKEEEDRKSEVKEIIKEEVSENVESDSGADDISVHELSDSEDLVERLSYLQRRFMALKIPVIIVLEGAYASGKGRIANELLLGLDARYTKFWVTRQPVEEDLKKPFLDQYFQNVPQSNNFTIFYRSWYSLFNIYKNNKINKERYRDPSLLVDEIKGFEKSLADNGYVLIKFKIRINPKKQAEHIRKMMDSPLTTWKAQEYDRSNNETYVKEMENLMNETSTDYAPWYIVEYTSKKETTTKVTRHVIDVLEKKLEETLNRPELQPMDRDGDFTGDLKGPLAEVDLKKDISSEDYDVKLKDLQDKMREVQYALYQEKIPLVLVFEGWDAAGKGGAIHRIIAKLDPTNYTVNTTAAPNDVEKNHHYLWRFAKETPKAGHIAIWDRSWYGRVMVERVEGFATNKEWKRAYDEINDFEKMLVNFNAIVLKFYIHIDKDTQLERFNARQNNPAKSWKITDEDWRNRDKWDKYTEAVNDMIEKTNTEDAPWIIVEGNSKYYARIKVLETIIDTCDKRLKLIDYSGQNSNGRKKKDK